MEILGGTAKNTFLKVPAGQEVRPTAVRARRALFDSLGDLSGKRVCDLFAGSGALGLEAVSRGATSLLSVEKAPASLAVLKENFKNVNLRCPEAELKIFPGELPQCCSRLCLLEPADLVFADPPYAESMGEMEELLTRKEFIEWCKDSLLIWELPERRSLLQSLPEHWEILTIRKFGPIRFMFLKCS